VPHDPFPHAALPPSGRLPVGQVAPTPMQTGDEEPVCTQHPPSPQRLAGQHGCPGPPHRPQKPELVTQTVSVSVQTRMVEGGTAGQQIRPAWPHPSQTPALHIP
jgi:hypothetical protein